MTSKNSQMRRRKRKKQQQIKQIAAYAVLIIVIILLVFMFVKLFELIGKDKDKNNSTTTGIESSSKEEQSSSQNSTNEEKSTENNSTEIKTEKQTQTETQTQTSAIDTDAWYMILVNRTHPVPDGFTVELAAYDSRHSVDKRILSSLQQMMNDAKAAGLNPVICSSYRTMEKQTQLYNNMVTYFKNQGYNDAEAERLAGMDTAYPGTSEHQAGLAVDIVAASYQILDKKQEETAEQKWLIENCYKYGFILRYPNEKSDITKIIYEPWHYRYVGVEAATEITKRGITLEEYLGILD